jgi:2-oxoglutarate ferredoxin oxidoreductase subunit gamma
MKKSIVISGYGGQGIILAGNILCKSAILENKLSTFFPSYGAEVRGGAAKCQIIISDEYIGSPIVDQIDIFLCFSKLALDKFYSKVNQNGYIFINSTLFNDDDNVIRPDIQKIEVEANLIAEKLGNKLSANMVMLGALIKHTNILKKESLIDVITETLSGKNQKLVELNINAFLQGYKN